MACQARSQRDDHHRQIDEHVSRQRSRRRHGSSVGKVLWQSNCSQRAGLADIHSAACQVSIRAFKQDGDPLAGERMVWMRDDQRIRTGTVRRRSMQ